MVLIYVQYFTANIAGVLPWAAAAHPVIAMVLFGLSLMIVRDAWRSAFHPNLSG